MSQPWIDQAERDLEVARHLAQHAFHEWACSTAQQRAEKAIKAVRLHPRPDPPLARAGLLDAHVQGARYPNYRGEGPDAPCKTYQAADSAGAIVIAEAVLAFCKPLHAQLQTFWAGL